MSHRTQSLCTHAAVVVMLMTLAGAAHARTADAAAAPSPAAVYLSTHPGGRIIDARTIGYHHDSFVVTLAVPGVADAVPNCPGGWFCFWDGISFTGNRGKLSSCYWQSLATYGWAGRVQSAYYNLDSGAVQFLNGNTGLFQIGVTARSEPSAGTNNNKATAVYRYC